MTVSSVILPGKNKLRIIIVVESPVSDKGRGFIGEGKTSFPGKRIFPLPAPHPFSRKAGYFCRPACTYHSTPSAPFYFRFLCYTFSGKVVFCKMRTVRNPASPRLRRDKMYHHPDRTATSTFAQGSGGQVGAVRYYRSDTFAACNDRFRVVAPSSLGRLDRF